MYTLGGGFEGNTEYTPCERYGYSFNASRRVSDLAYVRARPVPIRGTGPQWGDPSAASSR